ncbi:E3 ubiquitin-protein ligase WAV3-like [Nicotiana tabacum]|uniref:E3 ubiquitin-protein ligase WAV3-like n=2 Tax=Nicotiana TaxID=4085 RepID=A0A1S3ZQM7_TOBAC|nr:PREDICTED: uncharacterized protein LOC104229856 [Nicotiana sylvestris]XP_016466667.1 PREDICTED: uncharacterized protein LOC107789387 [Nicotiana tabacum]
MAEAWRKLKKALSSLKQQPKPVPSVDNSHSKSPAIPPSSSFSRSFTTTTRSSKRTCAICLGSMKAGNGQAIFTAECSHAFHFSCIGNSVKHGNRLCPICRCKWKEIPLQFPTFSTDVNGINAGGSRVSPYHVSLEDPVNFSRPLPTISPPRPQHIPFSDDEPLLNIIVDHTSSPSALHSGNILMKSFAEFPAVGAAEDVPRFAVLVGLRAPPLLDGAQDLERAPIDLVAVLDVSGSMNGSKLTLLKQAVCFVIDNLGPSDRLAIVTFSSRAQRNFPLRRMTEQGRQEAALAINGISANGGTNIVEGLKIGACVLEERREKNPVASIILLSDGRDTYNSDNANRRNSNRNHRSSNPTLIPDYLSLLPSSIRACNSEVQEAEDLSTFPVHTFGFGPDHDSSAMHAISDASGGTFSFIESVVTVQDAFAMCIGGLLSVVVQELQLSCTAASPGVKIVSIPSGRYASEISEQGQQGVINIGDLYADEEKEFLVYVSIPSVKSAQVEDRVETSLLQIVCSYKNTVSNEMVRVEGETVKIRRPQVLSPIDVVVSLEVDRQINRLAVAETIAEAQEMAERGNLDSAQALLNNRRSCLLSSASAQAGDGLCNRLDTELTEITERMASEELYEQMGRAYMLSGLSSHFWQRSTTRGDTTTQLILLGESSNNTGAVGYETPSMLSMVSKSQSLTISNPL